MNRLFRRDPMARRGPRLPHRILLVSTTICLGAALLTPGTAGATTSYAFELPDLGGKKVTLAELLERGPVLVNFWATRCKPCKKELPHMETLQQEFDEAGLTVVAISVDNARSVSKVKSYVEGHGFTFLVLLDTNHRVGRRFKAWAIPYTVLLDQDGSKVYSQVGYRPGDEKKLRQEVAALMNARAEAEEATGEAERAPNSSPGDAGSASPPGSSGTPNDSEGGGRR